MTVLLLILFLFFAIRYYLLSGLCKGITELTVKKYQKQHMKDVLQHQCSSLFTPV